MSLGGVHAPFDTGPARHTRSETSIVFVKKGRVLITGDVIQNKYGPVFAAPRISPRDWIRTIDALAPLNPKLIVPTHSPPGGGDLLVAQREFLKILDERARALKDAKTSALDATTILNAEMQILYPDWELKNLWKGIDQAYAE